MSFDDFEVDFDRCEVRRSGTHVDLTPTEFKLLATLIRRKGHLFTREQLLDAVWGVGNYPTDRVVDNHIMNLRRKIEAHAGRAPAPDQRPRPRLPVRRLAEIVHNPDRFPITAGNDGSRLLSGGRTMRKPSPLCIAVAVLVAGLWTGVHGIGQSDKQGEALLQAARNIELVKGDLKAAIDQYKKILARPDVGRTVAAKALLAMGQCYESLGQAEARNAYEQLLRQYGDQAEQVQAARARLAALAGTPSRTGATEMTIRRVWSGAGVDTTGSPSPDGRYLSFMDAETQGDLAIWEIASGQKRRLTNKDRSTAEDVSLASKWSPDGKRIAYVWLKKDFSGDLRVIGSDGSEPRILALAVASGLVPGRQVHSRHCSQGTMRVLRGWPWCLWPMVP